MLAFHNSHDLTYRAPFGAAPTNTEITLALDLTDPVPGYSCSARLWQEERGETLLPMKSVLLSDGTVRFTCSFKTDETPVLLWYAFRITAPDGSIYYYCNRPDGLGGEGTLERDLRNSYQITVYSPAPVPDWYKQAVVYQIFPERFARGSDWLQRFEDARHLKAGKARADCCTPIGMISPSTCVQRISPSPIGVSSAAPWKVSAKNSPTCRNWASPQSISTPSLKLPATTSTTRQITCASIPASAMKHPSAVLLRTPNSAAFA